MVKPINVKKRKHWLLIGGAVVLLAALVVLPCVAPPKLAIPKNLDLLGMIKHIQSNNDSINAVNTKIVGNMEDINHLTDTTTRIDGDLHELYQGLGGPQASLGHLGALSEQEVELSQSFVGLAGNLTDDLGRIKQAGGSQQASVNAMIATTKALSQTAQNVERVNGTIAGKLGQATQMARIVAQEMP